MRTLNSRVTIVILLCTFFVWSFSRTAVGANAADRLLAADTETNKQSEPDPAQPDAQEPGSALDGLQIDQFSDKIEPLRPLKPRTEEQQIRIEALTWYSLGRMHFRRGRNQEALKAFENAAKHDPKSTAILESLLLTAHSLNRQADTLKYAKKLIEVDADHLLALNTLARYYISRQDYAAAIKIYEQLVSSPRLEKETLAHVKFRQFLGMLYSEIGQPVKAAESFEVVFNALEHPTRFGLNDRELRMLLADRLINFERLGNAFFDGQKMELAIRAYRRALADKSGNKGRIQFNLARAYLKSGKPDAALAELQPYFDAQRQTQGRDAYELLSEILTAQGKSDELIARLRELAEKDRRNATLQQFFAETLLAAEQLEEAEQVLKETLDNSSSPAGFAMLAKIYRKQKRPNELLDSLARIYNATKTTEGIAEDLAAIAKNSELVDQMLDAEDLLNDEDAQFSKLYLLGVLASAADKHDLAEKLYRAALGKTRVSWQKNDGYQNLSLLLLVQQKFAESAEVLREAISDPAFIADAGVQINLRYQLTRSLAMAGETDEALETIDALIESPKVRPGALPDLKMRKAWIYTYAQDYDEAIRNYEQIISDYPENKDAIKRAKSLLSSVYIEQGETKKGTEVLEAVFRDNPEDPGVNNDLGYLYADQGIKLEQAEQMIRKALEAHPDTPAYLDSLGWVLYKRGKFEEALEPLEKAAGRPEGQDPTILDHLGDLYLRLGKTDQAISYWGKALKLAEKNGGRDQKLMDRIREKLKNQNQTPGELRPERPKSP